MNEPNERDDRDFLTALAIGAVVGIGAALLFRASDDFDTDKIIRKMKPLQKRAGKALHQAKRRASNRVHEKMSDVGDAGRIVRKSSGKIASNLGDDAAKIVRRAKREMEESAKANVKQAQRAMRRAAKRLV
jgi:gas vesicle protein